MLELPQMVNDPRLCYTIFYSGFCYRYSFESLSEKLDRLPYVTTVSKDILDTQWMRDHITYEYLGILYSGSATAPFYFCDEEDSLMFRLMYGE